MIRFYGLVLDDDQVLHQYVDHEALGQLLSLVAHEKADSSLDAQSAQFELILQRLLINVFQQARASKLLMDFNGRSDNLVT